MVKMLPPYIAMQGNIKKKMIFKEFLFSGKQRKFAPQKNKMGELAGGGSVAVAEIT